MMIESESKTDNHPKPDNESKGEKCGVPMMESDNQTMNPKERRQRRESKGEKTKERCADGPSSTNVRLSYRVVSNIIMAHLIEEWHQVVVQQGRQARAPSPQLQRNHPIIAGWMQQRFEHDGRVGVRVAAERAEAVARGVQVVHDHTSEEHFVEIVLLDEE
jgi:hypothetical protein